MPRGSESLRGKDIISDTEIADRIGYLAFLEDDENMTADDRDMWADETEELAALKELASEVGEEHSGLISEDYWEEYATQDADEMFNLNATGADRYFDYDQYADDLQTDYSQTEFMGTTYYYTG